MDLDLRQPEPELMDQPGQAETYAAADFAVVNAAFAEAVVAYASVHGLTPTTPGGDLLAVDLGCGPGDITVRVARLAPAWRILGIDGSPTMLALAERDRHERANQPPIDYLLGNATATGLANQSVGVIFSNSLLHHLHDPLPFWREIARLIRPGGVVFIRDLYRPASRAAVDALVHEHAGNQSPGLQREFFNSLLAAFRPAEIEDQLAVCQLDWLSVCPINDRHVDIVGRSPG